MKQPHDIEVSAHAVRQGRSCGLYGDTESRVRGIAAAAMPMKHPSGNRAYGPFVLHMRGTTVLSIILIGPRSDDQRPVSECKLCEGLMVRRVLTTIQGKEGLASRPCPRAFDQSKPLCDTTVKNRRDFHD